MVRCLFVEPFYGGSHRAFADGLARHSCHDVTLLTLEGSEWRKKMRRGATELAARARDLDGEFDLVVATDMLDLPVFLALTRPRFDRTPVLFYFHENQFTYPRIRGTKLNSWFGQINYLSALTADRVAFNSGFHRREFLDALRALAKTPNNWLVKERIAEIEAKSTVLPVGVELDWIDEVRTEPAGPPVVLWNHRWEFDKSPEPFVRSLLKLAEEGVDFEVTIAGEPGPNPHPALVDLPAKLPGRVRHHGYAESPGEYGRLLWEASVVVSTTRHEFFGIGTVEAMHAGCLPIVPNGFSYPELVPGELHQRCLYQTEAEFLRCLRRELAPPAQAPVELLREGARRFAWDKVAPEWDAMIARMDTPQVARTR